MYMIAGVQSPSRHLLLATPSNASEAISCYLAAKEQYQSVMIFDPQGKPIDIELLSACALQEFETQALGDGGPRTLH